MTKNEIIEKLNPRCNGYDLPLSLNVALIADILIEASELAVLPMSRFSDDEDDFEE